MSHLSRTLVVSMLVATLAAPIAAQTPAKPADAGPFLGTWTLTLDTPQGQTPLTLAVKNTNGTVTGEIGSDVVSVQEITDVSSSGGGLVFKYTRDLAGNAVPIELTLRPVDGKMTFKFDMAAGQIVFDGVALKK